MSDKDYTFVTVEDVTNSTVVEFNPSDLPRIITNQVEKMKTLERKIKGVMQEAENAKRAAQDANHKITFFSGRKEAIEELQSSGRSLASAVKVNAEALQSSFEFQKELAEISKFLFGLGVSNIAQNRTVVQQLELKLKGASQSEISELAKQEILSVVHQLKAQEDLLSKQEQFNKHLQKFNIQLNVVSDNHENLEKDVLSLKEVDKRHDTELEKQAKIDKRHDTELEKQAETDKRHDTELEKQAKIDKRHDTELEKQAETDKRHDAELEKQAETDKRHDVELEKQAETDKRHDVELRKQTETNKRYDAELEKQTETNKRYDAELEKQAETNKRYDAELEKQAETNNRYDAELEKQAETNKRYDAELEKQAETNKRYDAELAELKKTVQQHISVLNSLKETDMNQIQQNTLLTNQIKQLKTKMNVVILSFIMVIVIYIVLRKFFGL